jgi:hypothetical protein
MPVLLLASFVTPWEGGSSSRSGPTTPLWQRLPASAPQRFRLCPFRSPLLGASLLFSFPRGNEMFQFPRFPSSALCVQAPMTRHDPCQVFPFGDPRINACLAASRGLSQPATSFIGFQRQGIHRVPFATCRDDARARYGVHKDQRRRPVRACSIRRAAPLGRARARVVRSRSAPGPRGPCCGTLPRPSKLHSVPEFAVARTVPVMTAARAVPPIRRRARRPTSQ